MTAERGVRLTSDHPAVHDQPLEDEDERHSEAERTVSSVYPDARTAVDAVMILEALARTLEVSPHAISAEDRELHALYVRKASEAVIREAGVSAGEVDAGRSYGGSEWNGALLNILFEEELVIPLYERMAKRS